MKYLKTMHGLSGPWGSTDAHVSGARKRRAAILFVCGCLCSLFMVTVGYGQQTASREKKGVVKWHPGHYYMLAGNGGDEAGYMKQVMAELHATPALQGIQVRFSWQDLEPSKDQYDFSSVDRLLTMLAAEKKRMVILLQVKSFNPDPKYAPVPVYARGAEYSGGMFAFSSVNKTGIRGYGTRLWNQQVYNRMAALIKALGKRYNSNPWFEGIGFSESAFGQPYPKGSIALADSARFYENLMGLNRVLRAAFPNTMTYQFANYPRTILSPLIHTLEEIGSALGGPDIFLTDRGLQTTASPKGAYHYYPELSGIIPLAPSVQHENFRNTQHDGKGYQPTLQQLLSFARDTLKANYLFWTRDLDFYPQILELLNAPGQRDQPAGGLNPGCPIAFKSCNGEE
ncbi:hypothetical protein [Niabella aurantiaca]|uniref:hypothetical protein n=1 Tax=Niabella aurantiaca TaxID=379900 RepID=UPI000366F8D8|nr:hypothetical protein [Niabella aurantiaca]